MTGAKPRITIGLAVFNAQKYLESALDSFLAQTCADFELVICDNASSDRTQEICETYAARDPRIRYYRNAKNLGASPNFNRAFTLSSTEYFKWAPYDDLIEPAFLAKCIEILDAHPDVVLCYSKARIIDGTGLHVCDYDPGPDTSSGRAHERFRNLVLHPQYAIQLMGVVRSEVLRRTPLLGSFPSSDEVLLAELALRGRFHEIDERLYVYRRHAEQSTTQPKQRLRVHFFDTSLAGRILLPTWDYLLGCLAVIRRVPLPVADRARCVGYMTHWALVPAHARALAKDVLLAAAQLARRALPASMSTGAQPSRAPGKRIE